MRAHDSQRLSPSPADSAAPPTSWAARRFGLILTAVCVLALVARGIMLTDYMLHNPMAGAPLNDAAVYWDWAARVANGHWLQTQPFFSAPLYPYLLGVLRAVGGTLVAAYILQILADIGTACLLACIGRRRFSSGAGLLAAAFFLLLQDPASLSLRLLASSLQLALVTIAWALLLAVQTKPTWQRHVAAGAALGLLCLAYAPATLLVPLAGVWLIWQSPQRLAGLRRAALAVVTCVAVIAPATLHNWWVSRDLFWVQAVGGITLRLGNHPGADGTYAPLPGISTRRDEMHADAARVYREATGRDPTWAAVDRYFREQTLEYWRSDPWHAVGLAARKAYYFLAGRNYGDIYQPNSEITYGLSPWLRLAPVHVPWIMGAALVGLLLMLRRPMHYGPEWLLFIVPFIVTAAFWYSPRFRIPAVPVIVVAAAWALVQAADWRRRPYLTLAVAVLLVLGFASGPIHQRIGFDLQDPSSAFFNAGGALQQQGQNEQAIEMWRLGLKAKPHDGAAHVTLGDFLMSLERLDEARVEFEAAEALLPDDATLPGRIGKLLLQQRQPAEAERRLSRALQRHPAEPVLLGLLADAKQGLGQTAEALELFKKALWLAPDDARLRMAYADLLGQMQRWAEAREEFLRVAQALPSEPEVHHRLGVIQAQLGDLSAASVSLERAVALRPQSPELLYDLGVLYVKQARLDEAEETFRKALAIDPASDPNRRGLLKVQQLRATPPADTQPTSAP